MKKLFYASVLSLCMGTVMAQAPTNGLVAYYPFSGNANDASGNANNGVVMGVTLTTDRNGLVNSAYQFNDNNYITVPTSPSLEGVTTDFTIAAWVYIDSWVVQNGIGYASVMSKSNSTTSTQYRLSLTEKGFSLVNNGKFLSNYTSSTTINIGQWFFVTATATPTQTSLYINGNLLGTASYDLTLSNDTKMPLEIGRDMPGAADYFHGKIDELRIYNRALSPCEIKATGGFTTVLPAISGNTSVCVNQVSNLTNATAGGVWSSSSPTVATVSASGVLSGVAAGKSVISYTVTASGCTTVVSTTATVNKVPGFVINGEDLVCPNASLSYTVSPVEDATRYFWLVDKKVSASYDNVTSSILQVLSPDVPSPVFKVSAIGINACGTSVEASKSVSVKTNVPPKPVLTCTGSNCSTLSVNNPGAGVSTQWYFNDVLNSSLNGLTSISRPAETQIEVVFTKDACSASAKYYPAYCVDPVLRLEDGALQGYDPALRIYPNPNEGSFTFLTKGYKGRAFVINAIGSVVEEIELDGIRTSYNVSLNNLSKGVYLLKLTGGREELNGTFVIQ